jgi:CheY-like chemotaxis protein
MTANQTAVALHKILLVDDDKAMTYLNKLMLKESDINCQMDECLNGSEALTYIKNLYCPG